MQEEVLENGLRVFNYSDFISIKFDYKRISEISSFIKENNVKSIYFGKDESYECVDLTCLKEWIQIEIISINTNTISVKNFPILTNVKELYINDYTQEIDFNKFPNLNKCTLDWTNKLRNLHNCDKLNYLIIWKFKPKEKNLSSLKGLTKLEYLEIHQGNITTLEGIENLISLKELELHYATKLLTLANINQLKKTLNRLFIDNSKKIKDHSIVRELKKIKVLALNDCGDIKSLEFIKDMPNLQELRFVNSNVIDGNLLPCLGLKSVLFNNKRHYTHKCEEINNLKNR